MMALGFGLQFITFIVHYYFYFLLIIRTGPLPSRGRDLELEGGVNACHVDYVYVSRDSHVRGTE